MRRHGDRIRGNLERRRRRPTIVPILSLLFVTFLSFLPTGCRPGDTGNPGAPTIRLHTNPVLTFDPARAYEVPSVVAIQKIYEAPLQFSYDDGPYRLLPCLAEAMPLFSADNLTCAFDVRPDARFQDDPCFRESGGKGRPVTGADVVYSLKRIADGRIVSSGFSFFRGRISGLDEFHSLTAKLRPEDPYPEVKGLAADGSTVRIILTSPYPQLLWVLAMSYAAVVPHEALEFYGEDFTRHPVGTGPYRLVEWRRNYRLTYAASDTWYGGKPPIPFISQRIIADPTTRWLCFLNSELDICPEIPRDSWDAVMRPDGQLQPALAARGIVAQSIPALTTAYVGLNMDDPLLGSNGKLRRALNAMFDGAEWAKFHNGRVVPAIGPIPPGIAGNRTTTRKPAYNLDAARRLLAEAGFTNGIDSSSGRRLQLQLDLGRTDTETRESTELLVRFAERIGIVIQPNYNTQSAFFRKVERRQSQMFRVGWVADYPDAENFLQLFYSPNGSPGPNRANYRDPAFDRLYEKARTMPDTPERTAVYEELSAMVEESCPWIFLHHPLDHTLQHSWITNYRPHAFPYGMEKHYRIDATRSAGARNLK